jgi:C1A family cysteine protease
MDQALGAITSKIDLRDYKAKSTVPKDRIPTEFKLPLVRVKNQGNVGSCVAHALSTVIEYYNYIQHGIDNEMSVSYIYGNRETSSHKGKGMVMRDALAAVCKYGDVEKSDFPGNIEVPAAIDFFEKKKNTLHDKAYSNRISGYYKLTTEADIKAALLAKNPVIFAMYWDKRNTIGLDNVINVKSVDKSNGGHCMIIYGWNSKGWKIQNSWGLSWGMGGTAILPYDVKIREAWAITDNITDNLQIKKPFSSEYGKIIAKILNVILNYFVV